MILMWEKGLICLFPSPSLSASEKVSHLMFFKFSPEDLLDKDFTFLTHLVSSNKLSYLCFFSFPGSATKEYKLCTVEKVHFFVLLKTKQKKPNPKPQNKPNLPYVIRETPFFPHLLHWLTWMLHKRFMRGRQD